MNYFRVVLTISIKIDVVTKLLKSYDLNQIKQLTTQLKGAKEKRIKWNILLNESKNFEQKAA